MSLIRPPTPEELETGIDLDERSASGYYVRAWLCRKARAAWRPPAAPAPDPPKVRQKRRRKQKRKRRRTLSTEEIMWLMERRAAAGNLTNGKRIDD